MKGIIACSTISIKDVNEDCCSTFYNISVPFYGVIVADGLGSHTHSDKASLFAAQYVKKELESINTLTCLTFQELFNKTRLALIDYVKSSPEFNFEELNHIDSFSTTIICALETEESYVIAYLGNGSVWHIAGSFNQFSKARYLPWNSINLLNPHSLEQKGKPALYKYLSINDTPTTPTVLTIVKNTIYPGDWLMISTDGIYSYDSVTIGQDNDEKIWISGEETMKLFYDRIARLLLNDPIRLTNYQLQYYLDMYLLELKVKRLIRDDCTLGVIIPDVVLKFQDNVLESKNKHYL